MEINNSNDSFKFQAQESPEGAGKGRSSIKNTINSYFSRFKLFIKKSG